MKDLVVIVPVLNRPANAAPLVDAFLEARTVASSLLFVATRDDEAQLEACRALAHEHADVALLEIMDPAGSGDFARKINRAFQATRTPFVFQAADDLLFCPGWDREAMRVADLTGAGVVGTNDGGNPTVMRGQHSTHTLIRRTYVDEVGATFTDGPGVVFHEGYGHQWCNTPDAPILMGDLSFRDLDDVRIGDEVIGWQRADGATFSLNRLCVANVTGVLVRRAPVVLVTMESGREFRCTPDHSWLNGAWSPSSSHPREWVNPEVGRTLVHVAERPAPVPPALERLAGWLGGIYDGEGSAAPNPQIGQSLAVNPDVYERIRTTLDMFGFPYKAVQDRFWLNGGRRELLRFLHVTQPVKRDKIVSYILDGARYGQRDRVVAVKPAGEDWVVSLTTTTGNYVAWGYASKNCDAELVEAAKRRRQWAFAADAYVCHEHPFWNRHVPRDATYEKGLATAAEDQRLYRRRRWAWEQAGRP